MSLLRHELTSALDSFGMASSESFTKVPNAIFLSDALSSRQKHVLTTILTFDYSHTRECWPSILGISKRASMSKSTVRKTIEELITAGILTRERRTISGESMSDTNLYRINIEAIGGTSLGPGTGNRPGPRDEVVRETVGGGPQIRPESDKENHTINGAIDSIIDYLNKKTGSSFRHSETSRKPIRARIKDGFTEEDLKTVIDAKAKEWGQDSRMSQYLRPATLFGQKFEGYLQAAKRQQQPVTETRFSTCPYCGAKVHPSDRVCGKCGAELVEQEVDFVF